MRVKTVKVFECPECGETIPVPERTAVTTQYRCGECDQLYDDWDEAAACCKE